ncbi:DUF86 domain-containing protein [Thermococcus aggregans]|uniref:DUF86 domain-containing protein n=1 Tax=Thermococcus aggregans TaxID=110163 RepID=A0A9E7MZ82_THEAG|nr:HepT-like ribonuclease domain-containing protein [Thermococcus aggregans]USS41554.1 DUF86 domain-containing protein [Thermococcus aggregans]
MKKEDIKYKKKLIEESIQKVRSSMPKTQERFSKMGLAKDGIYKQIEFAIQNLLDALNEISSSLEIEAVSYRGIIESLHKEKIIGDELKEKLDFLVQLREVLIYNYDLINDEIAFRNMEEYLQFLEEGLKFLSSFLEGEE